MHRALEEFLNSFVLAERTELDEKEGLRRLEATHLRLPFEVWSKCPVCCLLSIGHRTRFFAAPHKLGDSPNVPRPLGGASNLDRLRVGRVDLSEVYDLNETTSYFNSYGLKSAGAPDSGRGWLHVFVLGHSRTKSMSKQNDDNPKLKQPRERN